MTAPRARSEDPWARTRSDASTSQSNVCVLKADVAVCLNTGGIAVLEYSVMAVLEYCVMAALEYCDMAWFEYCDMAVL